MTTQDDYQNRSYGEIPVGTGAKPGIVVVDFQKGFTEEKYPLGGAPLVMRALANIEELCPSSGFLGPIAA